MRSKKTSVLLTTSVVATFSLVTITPAATQAKTAAQESVTFSAAIQRALARNPSALIARQEIARAHALMEQTRSQSLPTLYAYGTYTRLNANRGQPGNIVAYADELGGSLLASAPLVSPQRWAAWAHAEEDIKVARSGATEVNRQVAVLVAHTYLSLITQHRLLDVQTRARDTAQAHVNYTHARTAAGAGPLLDEVRADQELDADQAQFDASLAQLVRQEEALGVLLGADHAVDVELDVSLEAPPLFDEALASTTRDRADVKLSRQRLLAAHHRSHDNYTDYLPTVLGTFEPFLQSPGTTQYPSVGWQAQIALSVPLYDGGLRYGQAHERAALEAESKVTLDGTERQARADVRAAYGELARLQRSLVAARSSAQHANEALQMSELAYRTGTTGNLEVIDAERRSRDAETSATIAEDAVRQATLDVLVASGRFPRVSS